MNIIIVELVKAIQDGQMLITDVPEVFRDEVLELTTYSGSYQFIQ